MSSFSGVMTRILRRWPKDRIGELIADSPQAVCGYAPTSQQFGSMLSSYPQLSPVGWGLSRNIRVPGRRFDQRKP
jgi:hypothetical protein